ncbi:MAG: ABC transporter permease [Bacillota bacterium]
MERIRIIFFITLKDLKESIKNRTAIMILLLPVIASLMFTLVNSGEAVRNFSIGISGEEAEQMVQYIDDNYLNFTAEIYDNPEKGRDQTASGNLDALIEINSGDIDLEEKYSIYLDARNTVNFFILRENISDILSEYHNLPQGPQFEFQAAGEVLVTSSILPIWLTVTITMIGLMIVSGSLAEEKENYTLAALLVSRAGPFEIIASKTLFAVILSLITSFFMGGLNGVFSLGPERIFLMIIIIAAGSAAFTGVGLLISLLSNSQAASRAISTVIYFPIIFPALIADVSSLTQFIAKFFPTYYLYRAFDRLIVYQGKGIEIYNELLFLSIFALILYVLIYIYFRKADGIVN